MVQKYSYIFVRFSHKDGGFGKTGLSPIRGMWEKKLNILQLFYI